MRLGPARVLPLILLLLLTALPAVRAQPQTDDDFRRPAQSDNRSSNDMRRPDGDDVRRRAEDLSRMPPNGADRQDTDALAPYGGPNPDLRGQIGQLGASIAQNGGARTIVPLPPPVGRRPGNGMPAAGERRLIPTEVVAEMASPATPQGIAALVLRNNLTLIDQLASQLTGTTLLLLRIPDQRPLATVIGALQADAAVLSAQPNYLFALQDAGAAGGDPLQYASLKLRLPEAHKLAAGDNVLVGVIDSGIDARHPELAGSIAATFDAIGHAGGPHDHGTAIAGLIVAHGRLTGTAPRARLLAVRAFDAAGNAAQGTTFNILKGLDWMAVKGARVINMSFAGPSDPAIHRGLEGAFRNRIMLIAAAGNAGPKSPPLFPGADPDVLAVTATDATDRIFAASNRGGYIAVAAPGVDVLVAAPDGSYQVSSGTSFSAAEVSGIAALMIQKHPDLTPQAVRVILMSTAKPLKQGGDPRLADAYQAVASQQNTQRAAGR